MNHTTKYLLLALLLLSQIILFGQKKTLRHTPSTAVVTYSDGSIFVGEILSENALELHLILSTKDTISLNKAYVKRIKRHSRDITLRKRARFHYNRGIFFSLQAGPGVTEINEESGQFTLMAGYRLNKRLSFAVGAGTNYNTKTFRGWWIETNATPVFAYARYYPFNTQAQPFVGTSLGWGFPNQNAFGGGHEGGLFTQPEIGVHFASRKKLRFILSIAQQIQNISGSNVDFDVFNKPIRSDFNLWFNRTMIKLGIEWK